MSDPRVTDPFGATTAGLVMRGYFQPRFLDFSALLGRAEAGNRDDSRKIRLPGDWSISDVNGGLTLSFGLPASLKFRMAYGNTRSINVTERRVTCIPFFAIE